RGMGVSYQTDLIRAHVASRSFDVVPALWGDLVGPTGETMWKALPEDDATVAGTATRDPGAWSHLRVDPMEPLRDLASMPRAPSTDAEGGVGTVGRADEGQQESDFLIALLRQLRRVDASEGPASATRGTEMAGALREAAAGIAIAPEYQAARLAD